MDKQQKQFTGVWIPREVADDYSLNAYEKILYVEIASFPVCYMLNTTLAERVGASERTVSRYIKTLINKGYVRVLKNDGRKRFIQAVRDFPVKSITIQEPIGVRHDGQIDVADKTICLHSVDDLSTIDNSIDNNINLASFAREENPQIEDDVTFEVDEDLRPTRQKQKSVTLPAHKKVWLLFPHPNIPHWTLNQSQRRATDNLIEHRGMEQIQKALSFYKANRDDPFCPQISTPYELDAKWERLLEYRRKQNLA